MILTDREIRIAIREGLIGIDPIPSEDAFSSTSVDLTLAKQIKVFKGAFSSGGNSIDPGGPNFKFVELASQIMDDADLDSIAFELQPGRLLLAWTRESVDLKITSKLAARVEGKSSLARVGLGVHVTAPTIHAGFKGAIQLEMINHGPLPIRLRSGMKICQLIFETTLGVPEKGYSGQFIGQTSKSPGSKAKRVKKTGK